MMIDLNKSFVMNLSLGVFMVLSGVLVKAITPVMLIDSRTDKINLEAIVPLVFDKWKLDIAALVPMVNPADNTLLNKIYSQTLSRTYISKDGEQVMLSIAYGRDQSADLQIHRPEVCYMTSGFEIHGIEKSYIDTPIGTIPVMRLVAKQGNRNEPITYWIRVGDSITRGWLEQKLTAIKYGLTGKVPDGLLFRVSSISANEKEAFQIQQRFLMSLLKEIRSEDRHWLVN